MTENKANRLAADKLVTALADDMIVVQPRKAKLWVLEALQVLDSVDQTLKMAPVQGYSPGIQWAMHLEAYQVYSDRYRPQEALIEGGFRGGFHVNELDSFIPGWRERVSPLLKMRDEMVRLRQLNGKLMQEAVIQKALNTGADVCQVIGVKADGTETVLGDIPLPDTMKAKDIIRGYFTGSFEDDMSDACMALVCFEEFFDWQKRQAALRNKTLKD